MGLEAGTYLEDLVVTNPDGAVDLKNAGDDHIRLLKSVLKNTFPGLAGRFSRWQAKSGSYTGVATDNWSVIEASGALTYNLTAAATLENGWATILYARAGAITVDPAGAETVNGAATVTVATGQIALLFCDGTKFMCAIPVNEAGGTVTGALVTSGSGTILGIGLGARMMFQQTSAPTGWTKETNATYNDAALRFVTGTVGTGGADAFSTHFGTSKSTAGHSLSIAEMPAHAHTVVSTQTDGGDSDKTVAGNSGNVIGDCSTTSVGSGSAHSHTLNNFNIKFADCIIAVKD